MIENLKIILSLMKDKDVKVDEKILKRCAFSLECTIEILEKLRNEERSIQNGNIE